MCGLLWPMHDKLSADRGVLLADRGARLLATAAATAGCRRRRRAVSPRLCTTPHTSSGDTGHTAAGLRCPCALTPVRGLARDGAPHEWLFWRRGVASAGRHGDWKLIHSGIPEDRFLFDLRAHPTERHDLSAERPGVAPALEAALRHSAATHPDSRSRRSFTGLEDCED